MRTTVRQIWVLLVSLALLGAIAAAGKRPAAVPELVWSATAGESGATWNSHVAAFGDGSSVVVGGFEEAAVFGRGESRETTLVSTSPQDAYHARYAKDGSLLHVRAIPGLSGTIAERVATLKDGSYVVCGYAFGNATFGLGEAGETAFVVGGIVDGFLARFDADGGLLWVNHLDSSSIVECLALTTRPDGSIVVGGLFDDELILGSGEVGETSLSTERLIDGFVACYEGDGSLRWGRQTTSEGTTGLAAVWAVSSYCDGSLAIGGDFEGAAVLGDGEAKETTLTSTAGSNDAFVARLAADGSLSWAKAIGGTHDESVFDVCAVSNGSLYVAGSFNESAIFPRKKRALTLTSAGIGDGFLAEFDKSGRFRWATQVGGEGSDGIQELSVLPSGALLVSGSFTGAAVLAPGKKQESHLTSSGALDVDAFVARYGRRGKLEWSLRIGGASGPDYGVGVVATGTRSLLFVGSFTEEARVGDEPGAPVVVGAGAEDALALRLKSPGRDRALLFCKGKSERKSERKSAKGDD